MICNLGVVGSNPTRGSPKILSSQRESFFALPTFLLFSVFYLEYSKKVPIFASTKVMLMSKKEKEEKAKEFWEYYEATQGTITITDPVVLD